VITFASEGDKPATHGMAGVEFGIIVNSDVLIADNVSSKSQSKQEAHDLIGAEFNVTANLLAQNYPCAVAEHLGGNLSMAS
jgi:hypothetical protein